MKLWEIRYDDSVSFETVCTDFSYTKFKISWSSEEQNRKINTILSEHFTVHCHRWPLFHFCRVSCLVSQSGTFNFSIKFERLILYDILTDTFKIRSCLENLLLKHTASDDIQEGRR